MKGDTLRFVDLLAMFPYNETEENNANLNKIYEFLDNSKK